MRQAMVTNSLITVVILFFLTSVGEAAAGSIRLFSIQKDSLIKLKANKLINRDSVLLEEDLEVDQLIFNETLSKGGSDFYEIFYANWSWPAGIKGSYSVIISERPILGRSTMIEISVNQIKVFENFLQPRYDLIEELSLNSITAVQEAITNYYEIIKELSGNDLLGTGIY
jgi:curli production assembly/transport component CsgE